MRHPLSLGEGQVLSGTRVLWVLALTSAAASLLIAGLTPASAHHSRRAYDRATKTSISGTVKEFELVNPHAWIHIVVTKPDGTVEDWSFEGSGVRRMRRAGWTADLLKAGDNVTVEFNPRHDGSPGGVFWAVTRTDGTSYLPAR